MISNHKQFGFTLIEVLVVIVVLAIISLLASTIIGRSLESYAALDRREKLQTSIRFTLQRITREIRNSLPNSICVYNGTACSSDPQNKFYFIPIKDSGRYQASGGNHGGGISREPLQVGTANSFNFEVLSGTADYPLNASTGDWISIYSLNNTDIYAGTNNVRHQIATITQKDISGTTGDTTDDIDLVQLAPAVVGGPEPFFANHSPTRRFHVIENDAVVLFYFDANKIYRSTTTFDKPDEPTTTSLLMENVEACTFAYVTGSQQRAGLLRIDITVVEQGETIRVIQEDHEYNVP